ncbi:MAG: pirin family protein [Legionella sp.]|nr:pirin family protein [Legionella sp.]
MQEIKISEVRDGVMFREGAGVKLYRYIGADRRNNSEPFLLFDYFDSDDPMDYQAGFPAHPHRGFETITYLLEGKIKHQDNKGHEGIIGPGDVQWMTAGKGVVHSEMPEPNSKRLKGLQLWLNLPAKQKLSPPAYQEFGASELPIEYLDNGTTIKVIAGQTMQGTRSPIVGIATDPLFLDIQLPLKAQLKQLIPPSHQALIFVLTGEVIIQEQGVVAGKLALLSAGEELIMNASSSSAAHYLLIAAKKIGEPIARLGPFVMNTDEEIAEALDDFRNNRF